MHRVYVCLSMFACCGGCYWPILAGESCSDPYLYFWLPFPLGGTGEDSDGSSLSLAAEAMWCGASLGGPLCYINNPTLRLFSHTCLHISRTCLHTTCDDDQTRRHISTNNRQTPSPWWWSRSPLQQCGFDESMPPKGWAAFRISFPMPLLKWFNRFNKLK